MKLHQLLPLAFVLSAATLSAAPTDLAAVRAQARQYLQLEEKQAREFAEKMEPTAAAALLSQVRAEARAKNPDIDRLTYLVAHLESQRAVALAQKRLNNLLLVIGLTVGLLAAFLAYVLVSQRQSLARLSILLGERPTPQKPPGVYRGE